MPPNGNEDRTLQVWVDGKHHTFRGEEIEWVLSLGRVADTPREAWEILAEKIDQLEENEKRD